MATTEDSLSTKLEGTPPEVSQPEEKKRPSLGGMRFDWMVTVLSALLVGGIYLDGWAHAHGKVDQSFFTPWHAALYSGFALGAAFLLFSLVRNHSKGYPWREALPAG